MKDKELPREHKKKLPVDHNIYLNDLLFNMCIEKDLMKKARTESMYLIRLERLGRMNYEIQGFENAYELYSQISEGIYKQEKNDY